MNSIAIATLHCNNRDSIFEVIDSFSKETRLDDTLPLTWVILTQGCSFDHNEKIKQSLLSHGFTHQLVVYNENLGWSRGMNKLYDYLKLCNYTYILHLEDDWLCRSDGNLNWFVDCYNYINTNPLISTLFLRKYLTEEEKLQYGWARNIHYRCFQHPNPFNYREKMKTQIIKHFRSLTLQRIPEFLYTANPTMFRLQDYENKKVFPFHECTDQIVKQDAWDVTTCDDAPDWGVAEALSMEKTRDLFCMNVNKGFFIHKGSMS